LHEHFIDPVTMKRGRYLAPTKPGYSIEMYRESLAEFAFPQGRAWHFFNSDESTVAREKS
jgi:L-fuconate dehydratase